MDINIIETPECEIASNWTLVYINAYAQTIGGIGNSRWAVN